MEFNNLNQDILKYIKSNKSLFNYNYIDSNNISCRNKTGNNCFFKAVCDAITSLNSFNNIFARMQKVKDETNKLTQFYTFFNDIKTVSNTYKGRINGTYGNPDYVFSYIYYIFSLIKSNLKSKKKEDKFNKDELLLLNTLINCLNSNNNLINKNIILQEFKNIAENNIYNKIIFYLIHYLFEIYIKNVDSFGKSEDLIINDDIKDFINSKIQISYLSFYYSLFFDKINNNFVFLPFININYNIEEIIKDKNNNIIYKDNNKKIPLINIIIDMNKYNNMNDYINDYINNQYNIIYFNDIVIIQLHIYTQNIIKNISKNNIITYKPNKNYELKAVIYSYLNPEDGLLNGGHYDCLNNQEKYNYNNNSMFANYLLFEKKINKFK